MSIKWMNWVWDNSPYERTQLLIHLAFADYASDDGHFWPLQDTVARKCRCSPRYVQKTLKDMRERGMIESEQRGWHMSNLYQLRRPTTTPTGSGEQEDNERDEPEFGSDND